MNTIPIHKRRRKSEKPLDTSYSNAPPTYEHDCDEDFVKEHAPRRQSTLRPPPPPPPFLLLPLEIRQQIYALCLEGRETHPVQWPALKFSHDLHPALLGVNRQIHAEAAPFLYTKNRFTFLHPSDCNVFTYIMDKSFAHTLTSLIFRLRDRDSDVGLWRDYFESESMQRSLKHDLPNLHSVLIFLAQGWPLTLPALDAYRKWQTNKALRILCASLRTTVERKVTATIVSSVRCQETLFEHLRQEFVTSGSGLLMESPRGWLRSTMITEVAKVKVLLEVQGPSHLSEQRRSAEASDEGAMAGVVQGSV
jgi:hypothetical protein